VTDPRGGKAEQTATFTVESVNDVPVLKPIPDQTIKEKEKFSTIRLDAYVEDVETPKNEIQWDLAVKQLAHGNIDGELEAVMDANREVTIKIPDKLWNGSAQVTFTATDADGATASHTSKFAVTSVNDPPVLVKKIADQTIKEKETFREIQLDEYVEDADHAKEQLKWTVTGGKGLKFDIDKDRVARVVIPDPFWNGPAETFTLTVTDPEGAKASQTVRFQVNSINDAPAIKEIAAQTIREGGKFADIDLKQFVSDPDHAFNKLTITTAGLKDLRLKNAGGVLTVTAPDAHWHGSETLTITAADPEGAKATAQVAFTVESVNDAPVISGLKGQKIKEKQAFQPIALDKISKDIDHAYKDLSWEFEVKMLPGSSEGELIVNVDAQRNAVVAVPNKLWHGAADVTFKVTDPDGATAKATERFEVESVNDLPVLNKIPDQSIKEGGQFAEIALDELVSDADHATDKLKWTVTGGKGLKVEIGKDRVARVHVPDAHWNGPAEKFKFVVTDPEGGSASSEALFTVLSVNDPPVLKPIKGQTIKEGGSFADIPLKDLVSDLDHKYNQLTWNLTGLKDIKANFTPASGVVKLVVPGKYW
ncbi:MAG: tandem-95 repeat protein, partial [Fibrobacterales bacterium]|nr:tandem-95 repeat protein [Fibrobacterales bacterium]